MGIALTCRHSRFRDHQLGLNRALRALEALSPDPVGGEGWVRGMRLAITTRVRSAKRCPLTLSSLPQDKLGGERNSRCRASRALEALSPDPVGGEGWVRGMRLAITARVRSARRCPITLNSLLQDKLGGERNSWRLALRALEALSPDPVGGEGWVRGMRLAITARVRSAKRCPLTLSSLPQDKLGGERNSWNRALCARWIYSL
jgi:hypothetical protein